MSGLENLGKKMFGRVDQEVLEKAKEELKEMEEWAGEVADDIEDIEDDIENLLFEICEFFNDCSKCPLRNVCGFAKNGCEEVFLCENCPRLRICTEKGARGLFIYLRDSKLSGGEE